MANWTVMKFGGTSVGNAERMHQLLPLVTGNNNNSRIVVLSAMAGTTDKLVAIAQLLFGNRKADAQQGIEQLKSQYENVVKSLFATAESRSAGLEIINVHFDQLMSYTLDMFTPFEERAVLAQGELLSTTLFYQLLCEKGLEATLLPALNFMRIDKAGEPDDFYIKENLQRELNSHPEHKLFITQGFICRNAYGEIDNLKRGGSDYTASLLGAALGAQEIQIWTDIDGMHNNDPRHVADTQPVADLSFDEAAELAYFGAKILHPASIMPAKKNNIPVLLLNTLTPEKPGTRISANAHSEGIKAVAAKDGITAIKIVSGRMLMAYGFLRRVFEIFESYKVPIDMITTSEVAISLTIDDVSNLKEIVKDLEKFGSVEIDANQSIICVVGDMIAGHHGYARRVFEALEEIPIRMISYGGSKNNISILIKSTDKSAALNALSHHLFQHAV